MKNHPFLAILVCAGALTTGTAQAALVVGSAQISLGNVLPGPVIAVSGDLLETSVASFSGEGGGNVRNGTTGTAAENNGTNPAQIWGQTTTIYNLDTSVNTLGYSITGVNVFSGWTDRSSQSYQLFYSLVGDAAFVQLGGDIIAGPGNGVTASVLTRTYDTTGAAFLTGVDAIQFVQIDGPAALDGTNTVYREFDVLGTATVPEPTSFALVGLALAGMCAASRRRG